MLEHRWNVEAVAGARRFLGEARDQGLPPGRLGRQDIMRALWGSEDVVVSDVEGR
jgi:hypothetical protein